MHINIVTVNSGWILQKIANRIAASCPTGFSMRVGHHAMYGGNNFYVDVQNCYHGKTGGIDIGLFTHVHENDIKHINPLWFTLDGVIHMSQRNAQLWEKHPRYPGSEIQPYTVRIPGMPDRAFEYKKRRIGIAQRGKYEGKGFHFMQELGKIPALIDQFDWIFLGNDWEEVVDHYRKFTRVDFIRDTDAKWPEDYARFYSEIDYLLIPSKWEGGPMSILEAAGAGVPIIASRVGWVDNEIPVAHSFEPGDVIGLMRILNTIAYPQKRAKDIVESLSYGQYAAHVAMFFQTLAEKK
jgi:glycosyltransferase involved in cell wall biosynthesis